MLNHTRTPIGEKRGPVAHPDPADPAALAAAMQAVRNAVATEGRETFVAWRPRMQRRAFLLSGRNLADYLALRQRDLRPLQAALVPWGLSSLGRAEAHVLPTLDAVLATLHALCRDDPGTYRHPPAHVFKRAAARLRANTDRLFGPPPAARRIRIMVTLPTEAAADAALVHSLVQAGMDCARINCAHDGAAEWADMVANVRAAAADLGRHCTVLMDLAGPKVRIEEILTADPSNRLHCGYRLPLSAGPLEETSPILFQARCSIPALVRQLRPGEPVWIDDGRIGARVESVGAGGAVLEITHARAKGEKLAPSKGLNAPDTNLQIESLTEQDRRDLDFVVAHADLVGYSFVQTPADIATLQTEMRRRLPERAPLLPLIAKIETKRAVRNLPELIVQAAGQQPFGVMIARGDLAVEIGYQRMAEIQEEMLWLCEAAHVPVIWATQVLEQLVKKGIPSRAEITDAAMAERAECVMLNKGPYVTLAVSVLDDVLRRMESHQDKKMAQLRALRQWAPGGAR